MRQRRRAKADRGHGRLVARSLEARLNPPPSVLHSPVKARKASPKRVVFAEGEEAVAPRRESSSADGAMAGIPVLAGAGRSMTGCEGAGCR